MGIALTVASVAFIFVLGYIIGHIRGSDYAYKRQKKFEERWR